MIKTALVLLIALPLLAYFCTKFAMYGYYRAKKLYEEKNS